MRTGLGGPDDLRVGRGAGIRTAPLGSSVLGRVDLAGTYAVGRSDPYRSDLPPVVVSAQLEATDRAAAAAAAGKRLSKPALLASEEAFNAGFRATLAAAKRSEGKEALRWGQWVDRLQPLPRAEREEVRGILRAKMELLHHSARADGTHTNRDRHLRDYAVFCRRLGYSPRLTPGGDKSALHEYVTWKAMSYAVGGESSRAPGVASGSLWNEVSSIRTYHREQFGIDLSAVEFLSKSLLKGAKRLDGAKRVALRVDEDMMIQMEALDAADGSAAATAHITARRLCFDAMARVSEVAASPKGEAQHYLLDRNVGFVMSAEGRPLEMFWTLEHAKNSQYRNRQRRLVAGAETDTRDFVRWCYAAKLRNAEYLQKHPMVSPETLAFVNVAGKPLSKKAVMRRLRERLAQLGKARRVSLPREFNAGTHSMRRGGARMWTNTGIGEQFVRWLGGWRSLAWLVYPEVAAGLLSCAAELRARHAQTALARVRSRAEGRR